jgi:putative endonuclease
MDRQPCVYILTNNRNGTLYIGVTSNLHKRIWEHKEKIVDGFSKKYNTDKLVWYEIHTSMVSAISREKTIKKWNRNWKIQLIEETNLDWRDLYKEIL